jgi:hypothetical protein
MQILQQVTFIISKRVSPFKPFQPILIIVGKARILTHKHMSEVERPARDEHKRS